ncbi:MAG: hypothetical protein AUK47_05675 [Deltaproteobacteria bacterium CG2_30_63_29]|nr:MAG: hypothetical protein AUK47_05675 [Deltaproteobacteria bacterium CG2_30_63_29]
MSKRIIRKKKKGGLGILLLITAAVGAGYFFKDCLPNFGIGGGGSGTSKESGEKDEVTQTPKPDDNAKNTVAVTIKGEECILGAAAPQACPKTCADIKEKYPAETRIEVNATVGTQATVEAFKQCVSDAGFKVSLQSE